MENNLNSKILYECMVCLIGDATELTLGQGSGSDEGNGTKRCSYA